MALQRRHKKWSAEHLASATEKVGHKIARQVIANIENGRRESVSIAELMTFASALEVSPVDLIFPATSLMESFPVSPQGSEESFRARLLFTGRSMLKTEWDPRVEASDIFENVLAIYDAEELAQRTVHKMLEAMADGDEDEAEICRAQLTPRLSKGLKLAQLPEIPDESLPRHEVKNLIRMAKEYSPDLLVRLGYSDISEE
ncbi:helix-turn-helix domain-containing protein [Glutamicibacter sp.]|uniref:helix-turn-helix domain-containing protein n=1 Tax=Glutamicibacter sp. TaxID=1931995 RepID=UPI002FE1AE01